MPRCYMVKKSSTRDEGSQPCSPTEASVPPSCDTPDNHFEHSEPSTVEYTELSGGPLSQRSAADQEAALDLLSLANSIPPTPPATIVTVLQVPATTPIIPLYVNTSQPTNIIIIEENSTDGVYQTIQTIPNVQLVECVIQQPMKYVAIAPKPASGLVFENNTEPPIKKEKPAPPKPRTQVKKKVKHECSVCGKEYSTVSNLSRHRQTHRSIESGAGKCCAVCGKMYVSLPAFSMHMRTHRLEHTCKFCGKGFSRLWLLNGHLRIHTGEKPYQCTTCGKTFADRSNLRAHLQTHSSHKNYQCSRCHRSFALKSYLNKHQESACVFGEDK